MGLYRFRLQRYEKKSTPASVREIFLLLAVGLIVFKLFYYFADSDIRQIIPSP